MRKLSILLLMLVIVVSAESQTPQFWNRLPTVGANVFPFGINPATGKKVQWCVAAGEFNQPTPATGGNITAIWFRPNAATNTTYTTLTIKFATVSTSTFLPGIGQWYTGPMTTVRSQNTTITTTAALQWVSVPLTTPYPYDPTMNLIIEVSQCGYTGGGFSIFHDVIDVAPNYRRQYSDAASVCGVTVLPTGGQFNMPAIGLDITPAGCTNASPFGSATIDPNGGIVTISTCSFAGEYSTISGAVNGQTLRFTSSIATDVITIHSGSPAGPIVASGTTPLTFANTFTGTLYAHWNTPGCGSQSTCRTTTVQCTSCTPTGCTFSSAFGSATINPAGTVVTISTCSFAGEYSTISGAVNGQTLRFTSSVPTDWITVHSGTFNGPIIAFGQTPLVFANTFTGTVYAHWSTNNTCGTQSACRTTTVQCTNCGAAPCTITRTSAAGTDNQTRCVNTAITNITYATTIATGATFSGLPTGVTGNWAAGVATISGTPTVAGVYNYTITLVGCTVVTTATGTITVVANPSITIMEDPAGPLCQGDNKVLTGAILPTVYNFCNTAPISIPIGGNGTPYPSNITASGLPITGVSVVSVVLTGVNHTWGNDVDVLLQSPTGVNVIMMSDIGGTVGIPNATYTFTDAGPAMNGGAANPTGTYKPTNNAPDPDNFPAPGPGSITQPAPALAMFTSVANHNGIWKLFVVDDDGAGDAGNITGGWCINFSSPTVPIPPAAGWTFLWSPAAGLNSTTTNPVAAAPAVNTTYTLVATNPAGCSGTASVAIVVNTRPAVTLHPISKTVCENTSTTFTGNGSGTGATYQWQLSTTGAGGPWVDLTNGPPYSGVTTTTLTINPVALSMNGYRYRLAVGGTCPPTVYSNGAILTVNPAPVVTVTPATSCGSSAGNCNAITASGANTYTWSPATGLFTNCTLTVPYIAGSNANPVYAAPTAFTTYTVTGTITATGCSNTAVALVNYTPPAPTVTPASVIMCLGDPAVKLKSVSSTNTSLQFCSGTLSIPVPDNNTTGVNNTIAVSGVPASCNISSMSVTWNMTHTWNGDMVFVLKAPNGNVLNLDYYLTNTGGAGVTTGFVNTKVSSAGVNALSTGTGTYTATFRADAFTAAGLFGPPGPTGFLPTGNTWTQLFSVPNGNYTLALYDGGAIDVGTLTSWCLDITYTCGVPTTAATWSPAAGLFSNAAGNIPYVAGTAVDSVWTMPTPAGVYNYNVTVQSLPTPPVSITTPMAGGNGNNMVLFNLNNSNGVTYNLTSISTNAFTTAVAPSVNLYIKNSAIAGNPGTINAGNGWVLSGTANNVSVTANTLNNVLTGLNIPIPAGATYGIALEFTGAATFPAYTNGTGVIQTYTNNGCSIITDGNVGWGGPVAPGPPANNPRNFNGAVTLSAGNLPVCTSPPRVVTVTVNTQATVTVQPLAQTVCTDKVAVFSATATIPLGTIAYQWQESTDGGNTYTNITNGGVYSGATTNTLTITNPPVSMSGNYYRLRLQGPAPCAPAYSFFRLLTVYPLPTVVITASPYTRLYPGLITTLSSTVSPYAASTYTWYRDGVIVSGATGATLSRDVDGQGDYYLKVTDVNGCTSNSNTISLRDSVSANCFLYPNPNKGLFQVRYHSAASNVLARSVTVYNSNGTRVLTQYFSIVAPYARMDLDLRPYGKGAYWVEIGDHNGNRITMCRAVVQ